MEGQNQAVEGLLEGRNSGVRGEMKLRFSSAGTQKDLEKRGGRLYGYRHRQHSRHIDHDIPDPSVAHIDEGLMKFIGECKKEGYHCRVDVSPQRDAGVRLCGMEGPKQKEVEKGIYDKVRPLLKAEIEFTKVGQARDGRKEEDERHPGDRRQPVKKQSGEFSQYTPETM
jgi:hypothetical protein